MAASQWNRETTRRSGPKWAIRPPACFVVFADRTGHIRSHRQVNALDSLQETLMTALRGILTGAAVLVTNSAAICAQPRPAAAPVARGATTIAVSGNGVDQLTTAIIHSKEVVPNGMIQKSTEIVDLTGDLKGRVLYHVTSVFDFAHGTLVNTGDQVYSGTVAGSEPVMIHDDEFRFEVNLTTGAERGRVYLFDHIAGPKVRCSLDVVGTGKTPEGNPTFSYTGQCTFLGG